MRSFLAATATTATLILTTAAAQAEFQDDHAGTWDGQGLTSDGTAFTYCARSDANCAKWTSVNDGCEGTRDFQNAFPNHADGWEAVPLGQDRCHVGLRVVLTPVGGNRIKADWSALHRVPVAEAAFMPVQ